MAQPMIIPTGETIVVLNGPLRRAILFLRVDAPAAVRGSLRATLQGRRDDGAWVDLPMPATLPLDDLDDQGDQSVDEEHLRERLRWKLDLEGLHPDFVPAIRAGFVLEPRRE
jgi:hypothetical protein